jgi:riboflavin synthase
MFTGIVEEKGRVIGNDGDRLRVEAKRILEGVKLGDSIDVNGACLTVIEIHTDGFTFELMPETRRLTNLGGLRPGAMLNLERALPAGGRMGGHMVQGHVDGTGRVESVRADEKAKILTATLPEDLRRYVVLKGFIAVDGVSLTVIEVTGRSFSVSLVGITAKETTLGQKRAGDTVNLETDIIGKYIVQFLGEKRSGVTFEMLEHYGYKGKA